MKKNKPCPYEEKVLEYIGGRKSEPELQEHLESCPLCRETIKFQVLMRKFSKKVMENNAIAPQLPMASEIWNMARASRKNDKELLKKAMLPLLVPQIISIVLGIFIIFMLFVPNINIFVQFISRHAKTFQFFKPFISILPKLFQSLNYIMIPTALFLSLMVIYFLFSMIKPKTRTEHS